MLKAIVKGPISSVNQVFKPMAVRQYSPILVFKDALPNTKCWNPPSQYVPYEGLNLTNQKSRMLGAFIYIYIHPVF